MKVTLRNTHVIMANNAKWTFVVETIVGLEIEFQKRDKDTIQSLRACI